MRILLSALFLVCSLTAADFELLIRHARVVDGTGNPWFLADVGVNGGQNRRYRKSLRQDC